MRQQAREIFEDRVVLRVSICEKLFCRRLKYLGSEEADSVLAEIEELSRMLASLISKLRD